MNDYISKRHSETEMKAIQCKVCGSSELTKKDGVFVCDYCGTKYSLDEVRKMMIEGTVEVTGTVRIDSSEQNRGKIQLALDAYIDMDYDRADALADEVILNDSTLSDAWYIKALVNKDSNYVLYERYRTRGDENSGNSLGLVTREKFNDLKFTEREDLVIMGFINKSSHRYLTVSVDGKAVHTRAPRETAV